MPDNTKVAVIKACLYDPQVNRTYAERAAHYDTAILPARPRRPRDKAKMEVAVLILERRLLGRLRHRRFYSLAELNTAIGELLAARGHPPGAVRRARPAQPQFIAAEPIALPNGASAGLVSITTSSSKVIFTACPTALRAARWRCG